MSPLPVLQRAAAGETPAASRVSENASDLWFAPGSVSPRPLVPPLLSVAVSVVAQTNNPECPLYLSFKEPRPAKPRLLLACPKTHPTSGSLLVLFPLDPWFPRCCPWRSPWWHRQTTLNVPFTCPSKSRGRRNPGCFSRVRKRIRPLVRPWFCFPSTLGSPAAVRGGL